MTIEARGASEARGLEAGGKGQDISMRSRPFYKLLLFSAIIGALAALLAVSFFFLYRLGFLLIWEWVPALFGVQDATASAAAILILCPLGGVLVGYITYRTKVEPKMLAEELGELIEDGRFEPRKGFISMFRGLVGLLFGGPIGPEGPLTGATGALGTWVAERRGMKGPLVAVSTYSGISGMFGAFLSSPYAFALLVLEGGVEKGTMSWKLLVNGLVASVVGYGVFFGITRYQFGGFYHLPDYAGFEMIQLIYAVALGLIGGAVGLLFIFVFRSLRRVAGRWKHRPISLALTAGLALGLLGALLPLTVFSGETEVQVLIDSAFELGLVTLLALGLVKVFLTAICLAFGWSGGYIFPSFFMGAAIGLATHILFPFIPEAVCIACVMVAVAVVLLRSPIVVALIVQAIFDINLAPVIAISVLTAFILSYGIELVPDAHGPPATDNGSR